MLTTKPRVINAKQVIFCSLIMVFLMCNNSPSSFLGIILNHNQAHLLAQQLAHVVLITSNTPPARADMQRNNKSIVFFFCLLPSFTDSQGAAEADARGGQEK